MAVDNKHPTFNDFVDDWNMMRDCAAGERTVKEKGETYLTMPSGFTKQTDGGLRMYAAYQKRAQYPDILQPTLQGMVGIIHRVEAQIEGLEEKKPLEPMWEKATKDGLTLEAFHRRITTEILLMGRYGILTDLPSEGDEMPYFAGYDTEAIINWSEKDRNLFVLDESGKVQGQTDEFSWEDERKYRVLRLLDAVYSEQVYDNNIKPGELIEPQVRGGKKLKEIPFVVVGPRELSLMLEPPPLIGVGRAALAIYRLDADYRHQLFHTGQETLFIMGELETIPTVYGSGVIVPMPKDSDAKFVAPSGTGINAHRIAIIDERANAVAAGVKLFDSEKQAESGEALRLRAAAQQATITTIAIASAAALEKSLRYAAQFMGQNPDEIIVRPNLQFIDQKMTSREAADLVSVWQSGLISKQTAYEVLQRGEIASPERTFEEEEELINSEQMDYPMMPGAGGGQFGMPQGGAPGGKLNGSAALAGGANGNIDPRFIEDGEGLIVEQG